MPDGSVTPDLAREYLRDVTPMWRAFWLHMHLMAKSLDELGNGLAAASDEVFSYHVSGQKNDVAGWVREVVGDSHLARTLAYVRTREDAARIVRERVEALKLAAHSA